MKKIMSGAGLLGTICWLAAIAPPESRAATFSLAFDTNGSQFANGSTSYSQTGFLGVGSLDMSYTPNAVGTPGSPVPVSDGVTETLGTFNVTVSSGFLNNFSDTISEGFTLHINQYDPITGQNNVGGTLSGLLILSNGTLAVDFGNTNNVTVGVPATTPNVTYALQNLQTLFPLDPGNLVLNLNGSTDLTATLTSHGPFPTPEPSTVALALSGLGAIGLVRLRRLRAKKAAA